MNKSLVYTKTGDKGLTGLIGGTRVKKYNKRLEGYGTIDELNAHIGMIRSYPLSDDDQAVIVFIQKKLFSIGGYLATDQTQTDLSYRTIIEDSDIEKLELLMDRYESELPPLKNFILPGGSPQVSSTHISRTVCRRAERIIVELKESLPIDDHIVVFINRLSDFLFVLSRKLAHENKVEEIKWTTT